MSVVLATPNRTNPACGTEWPRSNAAARCFRRYRGRRSCEPLSGCGHARGPIVLAAYGIFQQLFTLCRNRAMIANHFRHHLRVCVNLLPSAEPFHLPFPRRDHSHPHRHRAAATPRALCDRSFLQSSWFQARFFTGRPSIWRDSSSLAAMVGWIATAVILFIGVRYQRHPHPYLNPLMGWFLGLFCMPVGVAIVRGWRSIVRLMD